MRLEHLRAFLVLAEELNFRAASARLWISQPTLSAQIRELEVALGVQLFERDRAGTRITSDGEALLPYAATATAAVGDLFDVLGTRARQGRHGRRRFRVGVVSGGIGPPTWPALELFHRSRPDVELLVCPLGFGTAMPSLESDAVDALLLHGPATEASWLAVTTVGYARVGVLMPLAHPLARRVEISSCEVVPLLQFTPPPAIGPAFRRFWLREGHGLDHPVTRTLASDSDVEELTRSAAEQGGVGLWPTPLAVGAGTGAVVRRLQDEIWAPLQVATRPSVREAACLVAAAKEAVEVVGLVDAWGGGRHGAGVEPLLRPAESG